MELVAYLGHRRSFRQFGITRFNRPNAKPTAENNAVADQSTSRAWAIRLYARLGVERWPANESFACQRATPQFVPAPVEPSLRHMAVRMHYGRV
eukprot:4662052-Pleurochrysis_carterae.AAC.1